MLELFVSGSEKYSGKTFITAGLAATMQSLGYSTSVYKPVQTGAIEKNGFIHLNDILPKVDETKEKQSIDVKIEFRH